MKRIYYWNGVNWGGKIPPLGFYKIQEKPRNLSQNALYWTLLSWVADQSGNDKDYLHEMMKKKFLAKKKLVKFGKKRNFVWKIESTTKLSKKKFSEYYAKVEQFFSELGYSLPPEGSPEFLSLYESCNF